MLLLGLVIAAAPAAAQPEDEWQDVARIVVVGDVHGDYDNYLQVLQEAGLVNRRGNWAAGATHFVQIGDVPDRGPDTAKIIGHLQKLERQARRRGGRVHALIGNHEAMNMIGDLRYVHPGEYEALKSRRAKQLQDDYYDQFVEYLLTLEEPPVIDENHREQWNMQYPLGYVEHRVYWSPQGDFGKWVLQHNAAIKINDTLFVHGGIGPAFLGLPLRDLNEKIRTELQDITAVESAPPETESAPPETESVLSEAEDGPLWYRGLALNDETLELPHVQALLDFYQVERIVIGHTPGYGTIIPRFDARVVVVDSGISAYYGAHLASLLIEGDQLVTIQRDARIPIPTDKDALLEYYRQILALEPTAENLPMLIYNLEHPEQAAPPAIDEELLN